MHHLSHPFSNQMVEISSPPRSIKLYIVDMRFGPLDCQMDGSNGAQHYHEGTRFTNVKNLISKDFPYPLNSFNSSFI
ncbi:hypothetical protein RHMOL_Rhmol13G0253400 [Rhododendron molle]|uniref:Uncharacterized protein n=1 Tax=Rhododendron molle TaxID=49168 RepID=A0ACC0LBH7_RHOML|nr:hypothetical protein RHMOL_Rhmol13G0253400 [Rhododendron molle]